MKYYQTRANKLSGTDIKEVRAHAYAIYRAICPKTRRRPYIRSLYFEKQKVFLGIFWSHLEEKVNHRDKIRRLKYLACALEVIQYSQVEPDKVRNPNKPSEFLYRFQGRAKSKEFFIVQVKENTKTGEKLFISVYPT